MKLFANRSMKRVCALFLAVIAFFGVLGAHSPARRVVAATAEVYQLVTDASALAAGDKVVIVAKDSDVALSTTQNSNNRGQVAITKNTENNTISINETVQILTLEAGDAFVADTFAFNTGAGYLYAASSSKNYLRTQTTNDANGCWTIAITDDVATITAKGTNTRNLLKYNSGNSIFSCYASGQNEIVLYKLTTIEVEDGVCVNHVWGEPVVTTEATCTSKGLLTYTCTNANCNETKTEEVDMVAHAWGEAVTTKEATCTEEGVLTYTCTNCPETKTEAIAKTSHNVVNEVCTICKSRNWTFEKVTQAENLFGQYLIVYEADKYIFDSALTTLDAINNYSTVTVNNDSVTGMNLSFVTIAAVEGGYSIQAANGQYIGRTSDANGLSTSDTALVNTISFDADGNADIVSGGAYLRYNKTNTQMRFRYFKSTTYTSQQAIALYKLTAPAGVSEFEALTTEASFKLSYNEGVVETAKLRFGMTLDKAIYEQLSASNATYGVEIVSGDVKKDLSDAAWVPVANAEGSHYLFAAVLGSSDYSRVITARVYVQIGDKKFYMQEASFSIHTLADKLLTDPAVSDDAVAVLLTLATPAQ